MKKRDITKMLNDCYNQFEGTGNNDHILLSEYVRRKSFRILKLKILNKRRKDVKRQEMNQLKYY